MKYAYYTCDVFTEERFGGNPLAVFPEAEGLTERQMQQIAREFNYSETTFCFRPNDHQFTRRVRIFTPTIEVPFAGHPNVGTAFVLASVGALGDLCHDDDQGTVSITFEEKARPVPITIQRQNGLLTCELKAPQPLTTGPTVTVAQMAEILSLTAADLDVEPHAPVVASVGLPFLMVRVRNVATLGRAKINLPALEKLLVFAASGLLPPDVHVYTVVPGGTTTTLRARMFAPLDNVPEDPATGSANAALVALLTSLETPVDGGGGGTTTTFHWTIQQGVEMGRPSTLYARTVRNANGVVTGVWVRGSSVLVSQGWMEV